MTSNQHDSSQKCSICSPESLEVKHILQKVYQMMNSVCKDEVVKSNSNKKPKNCKKQNETFDSFLDFIFAPELSKTNKTKVLCTHERLKKFFCDSMKCQQKQLNEISHYLFNQNLKRTYQLQVISDQIKNISGTLLNQQAKIIKNNLVNEQRQQNRNNHRVQHGMQQPNNISYSFVPPNNPPPFIFTPFITSVSTIPSMNQINQFYYS